MRIEQLQYLLVVAETGSISIAAEKMHVSQPNISHAIVTLEREIGVSLFNRTRAGTFPTEAGKTIIAKAQDILSKLEDLKETAKVHSTLLEDRLSIGAISGVCTSILPRALSNFAAKYPYVEMEVVEEHSGGIEERLLSGKLDLGLMGVTNSGGYSHKHLVAEHFLSCKVMACVGAKSPLADKKSLSFTEILQHPIIGVSEHMSELLNRYGKPRELFHSKGTEAVKCVAAEGMAICFYMDVALKNDPYVTTGQIVPIPIKEDPVVQLYWVHDKKRLTAASEAFVKEVMQQVEYFRRIKVI
ncbi:LysR family transcriptional regulator [Cohnella faecalis]|uniref:LysR family transcriptional regulator n=1 Tax=Cohnella faecalis TaxID=2315694 RepID=A0A398CHM7_9BACL|nr:LysR family transcriptional regulator [Cohnella faecalis]RIE02283.1 LysR family transcriptional regulator [Cohnella faecalis]